MRRWTVAVVDVGVVVKNEAISLGSHLQCFPVMHNVM